MGRKRSIRTPSIIKPTFKKTTRIILPQTPERPVKIRGRGALRTEYLGHGTDAFILHRRNVLKQPTEDFQEQRAVSKASIRGSLIERIMYKALVVQLHFVPGVDFSFQSSMDGGRLEVGGMVADFLFPYLMIIIQVQGPTHEKYIQHIKDTEQQMALEEMGFTVLFADQDVILNEYRLEEWLRANFGAVTGRGASGVSASFGEHEKATEEITGQEGVTLAYQEVPGGTIDGVNVDFSTEHSINEDTLMVVLNGLPQANANFMEGVSSFIMATAPAVTDELWVSYERNI